ncbi:hypothetical protein Tco_1184674, partial [Tanacetum coccineum]
VPVRLLGLLELAMAVVCASMAVVRSAISFRMASKFMAGVLDVDVLLGGIEEEDGEWIFFLGGSSSSGTKKYRGSNSSDGGNTGDGVKIAGGVIGSGDEIEFSEELKELLPNEAGKESDETENGSQEDINIYSISHGSTAIRKLVADSVAAALEA